MIIAYSIIFTLSLLLPICYYLFVRKTQKEPWLLVLFISVCVVNLGYLLLAISKTVDFALTANKIAYFGQAFVPLCMFMIISGICGFTYKKWLTPIFIALAMLMFSLVLTTGPCTVSSGHSWHRSRRQACCTYRWKGSSFAT